MKKSMFLAAAALAFAACSSESLNEGTGENNEGKQVPISFQTQKKNITRATQNLESTGHYNFGVYAYKSASGKTTQTVMDNYLVGYGGATGGYDHTGIENWASSAGTLDDHKSPWFYEKLGTEQYTNTSTPFYTKNDADYMSANANQYLRYWDLAYTYTDFFCYAPYKKTGVDFNTNALTIDLQDGYDNPLNSSYLASGTTPARDRSLSEFMVAAVRATNADLKDVIVPFKHIGAQMFICFYEDIPGYNVEIIELNGDGATMAPSATGDVLNGVQATPSKTSDKTLGTYYTESKGTYSFALSGNAYTGSFTPNFTGKTPTDANLMFKIPANGETYANSNVPTGFGHHLTALSGTAQDGNAHNVIPESTGTGSGQTYAYSPTIYYPVAQQSGQGTGFTFHVSFRIIAKDNQEVTTVHNATVHVPADKTTWESNKRYIYRFKITKNATGSTNPGGPSGGYNPRDPKPGTENALYPIVFDGATIEDYTEVTSDHNIN